MRKFKPQGLVGQYAQVYHSQHETQQRKREQILSSYLIAQNECVAFSEDKLSFQMMYENISHTEEFVLIKEMAIDGKSHLEMAATRGITVSACRKRVQRAKEILKRKIKQDVTL